MNITGSINFEPNIATNLGGSEQNAIIGNGSGALKATYSNVIQVVAQDSTATWYHDNGFELNAADNWTGETSSVGEGNSHNNLPPYLSVYLFKRVS